MNRIQRLVIIIGVALLVAPLAARAGILPQPAPVPDQSMIDPAPDNVALKQQLDQEYQNVSQMYVVVEPDEENYKSEHASKVVVVGSPEQAAALQAYAELKPKADAYRTALADYSDKLKQLKLGPNAGAAQLQVGQGIPAAWLNQFKNKDLADWIANNVTCSSQPVPNSYGISASGDGNLAITPLIFNSLLSATQMNLLAFELGKVYWLKQADSSGFVPPAMLNLINSQTITEMHDAPYEGQKLSDLTTDNGDGPSQFGTLFRATLLNLQPADPSRANDWNSLRVKFLHSMSGGAPAPSPVP
jgi:hypothetical protein